MIPGTSMRQGNLKACAVTYVTIQPRKGSLPTCWVVNALLCKLWQGFVNHRALSPMTAANVANSLVSS